MKKLRVIIIRYPQGFKLQITEQTHRSTEFGEGKPSYYFCASNGINLKSVDHPALVNDTRTLYVRGKETGQDNMLFASGDSTYVPLRDIPLLCRVLDAVAEYNKHFKDK